jgi:hypothetical protein
VSAPTTVRSTPIRNRVDRGSCAARTGVPARSIEPTGTQPFDADGTFLSDHFGRQTRPTAT